MNYCGKLLLSLLFFSISLHSMNESSLDKADKEQLLKESLSKCEALEGRLLELEATVEEKDKIIELLRAELGLRDEFTRKLLSGVKSVRDVFNMQRHESERPQA